MASIIWAVWIPWYRIIWGICTPVTKIRKILDDDCPQCEPVDCYSDDGTAILPAIWYEWECNPHYNDEEIFDITTAQTFAADTYHSLSFVILSGTADVTIGTTTVTALPTTFSDKYKASTLLANAITITPGSGARVLLTTIK